MEQLPDDMLANVLGRLPPSSLAASRCVRKHWCSIIDARRLLRADLLPLRVEAFFCNSYFIFNRTFLFARPTAAIRIPGGHLDFFDDDDVSPMVRSLQLRIRWRRIRREAATHTDGLGGPHR